MFFLKPVVRAGERLRRGDAKLLHIYMAAQPGRDRRFRELSPARLVRAR